ncbi:MAG TPA: iron-sulfur cluster assembly accessory protein [Nitrosomonas europaea]|uniref:HesB/IscA family protein n=1 Tax=Nitrosomonas europaea TaxID=915 RepID=UPI002490AFEA|nr:iron-sulfur cluster assembly accessory protein [Nitrosomonas europaea]HRN81205.1 iron-sulfur cluster assembly accessory protein [Nitrosomonas europaea]HRO56011.1 iron-sulfur cluster assembly accessory protein [Nitrosomonas europaea]HRQ07680.1 iron-sulfur cluster assembly accessory protein [Nitrosomonas europaea]HUM73635.1 iron-sulfur cluster assembly accessory protein [Nitrosomonas europaea]
MAITLTERAARQIRQQLERRGKGVALRLGVKKSGCSGFAYSFDYADEVQEDDQLFESYDAQVVVQRDQLSFIDGSEIDFIQEGLNSSFKFRNPNIDNTCGCGESFSLKT